MDQAQCVDDDACAPGLDCAGGRCVAFGQVGATCGSSGVAACALGLQCDNARDPATCQPLTWTAVAGATCNPGGGALCVAGQVCAQVEVGTPTYRCQAPAAAGGACYRAVPNGCPSGQVCVTASGVATGSCTPQAVVGQPCLTGSGVLFGCVGGTTCDFDSDLCVALVDNGQAWSGLYGRRPVPGRLRRRRLRSAAGLRVSATGQSIAVRATAIT